MHLLCKLLKNEFLRIDPNIFADQKFIHFILKIFKVFSEFLVNIWNAFIVFFRILNDKLESRAFVTNNPLSVLVKVGMISNHSYVRNNS